MDRKLNLVYQVEVWVHYKAFLQSKLIEKQECSLGCSAKSSSKIEKSCHILSIVAWPWGGQSDLFRYVPRAVNRQPGFRPKDSYSRPQNCFCLRVSLSLLLLSWLFCISLSFSRRSRSLSLCFVLSFSFSISISIFCVLSWLFVCMLYVCCVLAFLWSFFLLVGLSLTMSTSHQISHILHYIGNIS